METVQAIFTQLGVNSSLLPQFVVVLVVFVLAQSLFLSKLQQVLESREEKTVKLENSADETFENVQKMQQEYKTKIDRAQREAFRLATEKKNKIATSFGEQYRSAERDVTNFVDQSRVDFHKEVEKNKEEYLAASKQLADSLVQKILQ